MRVSRPLTWSSHDFPPEDVFRTLLLCEASLIHGGAAVGRPAEEGVEVGEVALLAGRVERWKDEAAWLAGGVGTSAVAGPPGTVVEA
mmetsp:Transcript_18796/g.43852  ORF Transcript_18796/g.43852 Transcript_18796/m.43852 type:complete len:87 (+) Transcript_18796:25-285(+)